MIRMTEPMALTAVAGLLAAIAVGSRLYRTGPRCPRCGAQACTADEPPSDAVRAVRNDGRSRPESKDSPRGTDRYRGVDRKVSSRVRTVSNAVNFALFRRRGSAGFGAHPVGAMSDRADPTGRALGVPRSHKTLYRADVLGALPLGASATPDELCLAVRAVHLHTPRQWPGGVYCSNDRSSFPCRLRRWGEDVLLSEGWSAEGIAALDRQADADGRPLVCRLSAGAVSRRGPGPADRRR
jgi:hypothetical protein